MSRGIVYYNKGTKCMIRLLVSLYTLRKVYRGDIKILHEGKLPEWFIAVARKLKTGFVEIPEAECGKYHLLQKTRLHKWSPFDTSLFIDSDTVVLEDPSELFDVIEVSGFAVARFSDWKTDAGGAITKRIKAWLPYTSQKQVDDAIAFGPAVNTGTFGWTRQECHQLLFKYWENLTAVAVGDKSVMPRTLDETALQMIVPVHIHALFDERWNRSVKHGITDKPAIIHYHGGKHLNTAKDSPPEMVKLCDKWREAYGEMLNGSLYCKELMEPHGDRALKAYHKSMDELTASIFGVQPSDDDYEQVEAQCIKDPPMPAPLPLPPPPPIPLRINYPPKDEPTMPEPPTDDQWYAIGVNHLERKQDDINVPVTLVMMRNRRNGEFKTWQCDGSWSLEALQHEPLEAATA